MPYCAVVTIRPKMACRACNDGVFQSPAPKLVAPGGLPTEKLIADVVVKKYAYDGSFYRQSQIMRRYGIGIDRGILCNWAGRFAAHLKRIFDRLKALGQVI